MRHLVSQEPLQENKRSVIQDLNSLMDHLALLPGPTPPNIKSYLRKLVPSKTRDLTFIGCALQLKLFKHDPKSVACYDPEKVKGTSKPGTESEAKILTAP
jgi:hypothetical protein